MSKVTKEQVLKQINHLVVCQQKMTSNMMETLGENGRIIESLFPFRNNGESLLVSLGLRIVDEPEQQTFINVSNFYHMAHKDDALEFGYPIWSGGEEIYDLSMRDIMELFGL